MVFCMPMVNFNNMGELNVWVNGIINTISGLDASTTCKETVVALAQSYNLVGRFNLIEKTPTSERLLHPQEHPIKILQKWAQGSPNYFILRKKNDSRSPSTSRPSSASSHSSPVRSIPAYSPPLPINETILESTKQGNQRAQPPPVKPKPKLKPKPVILKSSESEERVKPVPLPRKSPPYLPRRVEEVFQKSQQEGVSHQPDLLLKDSTLQHSRQIPKLQENPGKDDGNWMASEAAKQRENEKRMKALDLQRERQQQVERALVMKRKKDSEETKRATDRHQTDEEQRVLEEKKKQEEIERKKAIDEKLRQDQMERQRREEEDRRKQEMEKQREREERRRQEEVRQQKEKQRLEEEEEKRRQLEEKKRQDEAREHALQEQKKLQELERQRAVEEKRRKDEEDRRKREEEERAIDEQRKKEQQEKERLEQEKMEMERQLKLQKKQAEEKKRLLDEKRKEEIRKRDAKRKKALEEERRKIEEEKQHLEDLVKAQECKLNHQKSQLCGLDAAIQALLHFESDPAIDRIQEEITNIEHSIRRNQAMLNEKEFWENELDLERQMHTKLEASLTVLKDKAAECDRLISQRQAEATKLSKTLKKEEKKVKLNEQQAEEVKAVKDELKELKHEYKLITSNLEKVNEQLGHLDMEFQEKQKELKLVEEDYEKEKTTALHIIIPGNNMENTDEGTSASSSIHRILKGSPRQLALATPTSDNPEGIFL